MSNKLHNLGLKQQEQRQKEFSERMKTALDGVEYPKDKIPMSFDLWLEACLKHISFSSLNMTIDEYMKFTTTKPSEMSIGYIHKAVDIVIHSSPAWFPLADLSMYAAIIRQAIDMENTIIGIIAPLRDGVIKSLEAKSSIIA